jgi:hypothetical protein
VEDAIGSLIGQLSGEPTIDIEALSRVRLLLSMTAPACPPDEPGDFRCV